jgi:N-methylhydantoinase A/oxoprolinase/acetone carboxylase beta subunit
MARPALLEKASGPQDASGARSGERAVAYGGKGKAGVYKWELLEPGNEVAGCALLVSENSTYFVPEGWKLTIDRYGNGVVRRVEAKSS